MSGVGSVPTWPSHNLFSIILAVKCQFSASHWGSFNSLSVAISFLLNVLCTLIATCVLLSKLRRDARRPPVIYFGSCFDLTFTLIFCKRRNVGSGAEFY